MYSSSVLWRTTLIVIVLGFTAMAAWAQPANDACQNAVNVGALTDGVQTCFNGDNTGANPEFPYPYQNGCQPGGNMSNPAGDVWYTFTTPIGINQFDVTVSGTMDTINVGFYTGNCGGLNGAGCVFTTSGNANVNLAPAQPNTTYYIQVSGGSPTDEGTFDICVTPSVNNNICVIQSSFSASPPPTNGFYFPGDVVTFCYTVSEFDQQSANWFHGISLNFGSAWDLSTLTPVSSPASCDGNGSWDFYNSITSSATGFTTGPGFFYDSDLGSPLGIQDGDPGNNYGDNCSLNDWEFCFSIQVQNIQPDSCVNLPSPDLSIDISQWGDGETGSWSSPACAQDPPYQLSATLQCCAPPTFAITDPGCGSSCTGQVTATGQGTAPFEYYWSTGDTGATITGLCPGSYDVTVVDDDSCLAVGTAVITPGGSLQVDVDTTDVSCGGADDGAVDLTVLNGTTPITYNWSTGDTTEDLTGIAGGNYTVTVTDSSGCADTIAAFVDEPPPLTLALDSTDVSCNGAADGAVDATVGGGTTPYSYAWSSGQATEDINGLDGGVYAVTVTDDDACEIVDSITVNEPDSLELSAVIDSGLCGGSGSIDLTVNGGQTPYNYNWSSGESTEDVTNLPSGSYTVTVTDDGGCSDSLSTDIFSSPPAEADVTVTDALCAGEASGTASVTPTNGTGSFTFAWSGAASTADTVAGLTAGTYTVTVTDSLGCEDVDTFAIAEPDSIVLQASVNDVSCNGADDGTIDLTVSGGVPAYVFLWSESSATEDINTLAAGTYDVTVTDDNGCTATGSYDVSENPPLSVGINVIEPSCYGFSDGSAIVSAQGGTGNFNYIWSDGAADSPQNSGLQAGTYDVTVMDGNGCDTILPFTVPEPDSLGVDIVEDVAMINLGDSIELTTNYLSSDSANAQYEWFPFSNLDCDTCAQPVAFPYNDQAYTVTYTEGPCVYTDSVMVMVDTSKIMYVPNAFSPNGDGVNDVFEVYTQADARFVFRVYNRWGGMLFETRDISQGWDGTFKGKEQMPGVYIWELYIEYIDRTAQRHHGSVTLLR